LYNDSGTYKEIEIQFEIRWEDLYHSFIGLNFKNLGCTVPQMTSWFPEISYNMNDGILPIICNVSLAVYNGPQCQYLTKL
jgi:hypothetical protein